MKIAVIQGSSQCSKNSILEKCARECPELQAHEILNFGVFAGENAEISYVETAICISLLLSGGAVDFVITGCSSGQGMMLACNVLPGVICGFVQTPSDAYLFGRINNGNAVSYPLGLNFGWAGEINLKSTLSALFSEPFGMGYPLEDAPRKRRDAQRLFELNRQGKRPLSEILPNLDPSLLESVLKRRQVCEYVLKYGHDESVAKWLREKRP